MFRSSEFGRLRGAAKGDARVVRRGESDKDFIKGRKR